MAPANELTQIELTVFFDAACCVCAADGRLSGREMLLVLARLREANVRAPEEELKSLMQRRAAEIYKHGLDRAGANVASAIRETTNPRLRTLIRSTLPPLVEADGKRSAREVQAARVLLEACDAPPPAPIGEGRPSASSPESTLSGVAVWVVPSVIGAFALVVVMFTMWLVRSTNRADEEAANGRLTVAMTAAQEWIDGTSKVEADVVEQQLVKAIADRYVTEKTAGDAMLERLRGHREALASQQRVAASERAAMAATEEGQRAARALRQEGQIKTDLEIAGANVAEGIRIDAEVPTAYWVNLFDALVGGKEAAERSTILEKKGVGAYLQSSSLFVGSEQAEKNRNYYMGTMAPEMAKEQSASFRPVAEATLKLFETKLKTGTSMQDVLGDLKNTAGAPTQLAENIARANPLIQEQLLLIQASNELDDRAKKVQSDLIIAQEANYRATLALVAKQKEIDFEALQDASRALK